MSKSKAIISLPAYNEEVHINSMVIKCRQYGDEVLVVDDGSSDDTAQIAKEAGATVVQHIKNKGAGAAIQTIIIEARKREFDVLVTIDADNQHNPEDIPNLIKPIMNGYDLVIGSRNRENVPHYRNLGGMVLSIFTCLLSGKKVIDSQCGFRAYSPKAVREIELKENGMAWASEMLGQATKKHLQITEVPIVVQYTKDSSTLNPIYQGFYTLYRIIVMMIKKVLA